MSTARTVQQLFNLSGKTALITGGSRGLGLQMAEALGEQGASIVLSSRKQSDLDEAVAHLQKPWYSGQRHRC
jgi:gluconate 5-dehydrogenase